MRQEGITSIADLLVDDPTQFLSTKVTDMISDFPGQVVISDQIPARLSNTMIDLPKPS
jgi:hypothetical protein